MSSHTVHRQAVLQLAKTLFSFGGKNKAKQEKTNEEKSRKHKALRKTVSLGSPSVEMDNVHDVWFDPGPITKYEDSKCAERTLTESFKPKFHSQKVKGVRRSNKNPIEYFLQQPKVKQNQYPEKPGRRKFSLKVISRGAGKLERRNHNLSCPDLAKHQEEPEKTNESSGARITKQRNKDIDQVDSLDRNTAYMFRDKHHLETELIEIYFE